MDQTIRRMNWLLQNLSWEFGGRRFDDSCCVNLTYVEFMTLKQIIHCTEIPALALAARMGITKGGMSKIIDRLEKKKYVRRERNQSDGRICCVVPSEAAKKVLDQCEEQCSAALADLLQGTEPKQIDVLRDSLEFLALLLANKHQGVQSCSCTR